MKPLSSSNAKDKDTLWKKITKDVNSVSLHTRECAQIKTKWSDWAYTTKKKKKHLSSMDQKLVDFLTSNGDSASESSEKDDDTNGEKLPDQLTQSADRYDLEESILLTSLIHQHHAELFGAFSNTITHELKYKL